jgi:MFS family permease
MFVRIKAVRESRPSPERHPGRLGAIGYRGVRTIVLTALCLGLAFGSMEVAMPAFAESEGHRALAGVLLACFALGSLVGGVLAGLTHVHDPLRRILQMTLVMPPVFALSLLAGSVPLLCVTIFAAGLPLAPLVANIYALVGRIAPETVQAETFGWFATAVSAGIATGTALGGLLVDEVGLRAPMVLGIGGALAAAGVVYGRRATLAESHR